MGFILVANVASIPLAMIRISEQWSPTTELKDSVQSCDQPTPENSKVQPTSENSEQQEDMVARSETALQAVEAELEALHKAVRLLGRERPGAPTDK